MGRWHLFEIHDQPWFPTALRNYVTDVLGYLWNVRIPVVHPRAACEDVAKVLAPILQQHQVDTIVDLCSGGGGPWTGPTGGGLQRELASRGADVRVILTDLYPNATYIASNQKVSYHKGPVDAMNVDSQLCPHFRTIFAGFHHMTPENGRSIISAAVNDHVGIAIFEYTENTWYSAFRTLLYGPLAVLLLTPRLQWSVWRFVWTYVFPVVPLVFACDGFVSSLRTYSSKGYKALTIGLTSDQRLDATEEVKQEQAAPDMRPAGQMNGVKEDTRMQTTQTVTMNGTGTHPESSKNSGDAVGISKTSGGHFEAKMNGVVADVERCSDYDWTYGTCETRGMAGMPISYFIGIPRNCPEFPIGETHTPPGVVNRPPGEPKTVARSISPSCPNLLAEGRYNAAKGHTQTRDGAVSKRPNAEARPRQRKHTEGQNDPKGKGQSDTPEGTVAYIGTRQHEAAKGQQQKSLGHFGQHEAAKGQQQTRFIPIE